MLLARFTQVVRHVSSKAVTAAQPLASLGRTAIRIPKREEVVSAHDLLLFKHDRKYFGPVVAFAAITQTAFWSYMAYFTWTVLDPENLKKQSAEGVEPPPTNNRKLLSTLCIIMATAVVGAAYIVPRRQIRAIRYLAQNRTVPVLQVETQAIFGPKTMDIPLGHLQRTREFVGSGSVPLSIDGMRGYWILSMDGLINDAENLNRFVFPIMR